MRPRKIRTGTNAFEIIVRIATNTSHIAARIATNAFYVAARMITTVADPVRGFGDRPDPVRGLLYTMTPGRIR